MAKGHIGATPYRFYIGAGKIKAGYLGTARVYSAGSTVTYVVDSGISYTEEVDSGASCLSPRTFTPSKAGWSFVGWRSDIAAAGEVYSSLIMGDNPITLYAVFSRTITVTYQGITAESKLQYYNNGALADPVFSCVQPVIAGWTARGWSIAAEANGGITYGNGATFTRNSDVILYSMYQQTITLSYNGNGVTVANPAQTGTRYYNASSGAVVNPVFTLAACSFTGAGEQFLGWSTDALAAAGLSAGTVVTLDANATYYALWYLPRTLTICDLTWTIFSGSATSLEIVGDAVQTMYGRGEGDNLTFHARSSSLSVKGCATLELPPMTGNGKGGETNHYFKIFNQSGTLIGHIKHEDNWYQTRTFSLAGCISIYFECAATKDKWTSGGAYIQVYGNTKMY